MNPLGSCQKCHGPLCVSGQQVVCGDCGLPHPEHPKMKEWAEANAAPPPPRRDIPAIDYASSIPDRVKRLEEQAAAQAVEIAALRDALAPPEGAEALAEPRRKRKGE